MVLGRQVGRQSSGLGRLNNKAEDSQIVPEILDSANSVTQIENVQNTPVRYLHLQTPSALEGILSGEPSNQSSLMQVPSAKEIMDPNAPNPAFTTSRRFNFTENVVRQNFKIAETQRAAAAPIFMFENIASEGDG